jgi:UDP-2,3-diacylglucosamine pyrophosphatase LpxH
MTAVVAFLSDIHYPDEDPAAWRLTLRLLRKIQPTIFFWGGDIFDFESPSSYVKDPVKLLTLQEDLDIGFSRMLEVRRVLPNAVWYFKEGNHEQRLKKFLFTKAAELSPLRCLQLQNLLRLDELECAFIDNDEKFKIGELFFMHGNEERVGSVYPARNLYFRLGVNLICGHFHRKSDYGNYSLDRKDHGVWVNSCLQRRDPKYAFHTQWTHGFHVIEFSKNGRFHVEPFTYFRDKGRVCYVWNGKLLSEKYLEGEAPARVREHRLVS